MVSNWDTPMHGIGQENGADPAIWAVLSSPLLNLLQSKGFGCVFLSPFSKEPLAFVGYAFVDDSYLGASSSHIPSGEDSFVSTQRNHQISAVNICNS